MTTTKKQPEIHDEDAIEVWISGVDGVCYLSDFICDPQDNCITFIARRDQHVVEISLMNGWPPDQRFITDQGYTEIVKNVYLKWNGENQFLIYQVPETPKPQPSDNSWMKPVDSVHGTHDDEPRESPYRAVDDRNELLNHSQPFPHSRYEFLTGHTGSLADGDPH